MTIEEAIRIVDPREKSDRIQVAINMRKAGEKAGNTPISKPVAAADLHRIDTTAAIIVTDELRKRQWISVEDRLPKPEEEVIVFVVHENGCKIITTGMHEDGNVAVDDSLWSWNDIVYDKENDVYLIPHGWWEWNHYNPDNIYVEAIDGEVTHWMPLPEPPKEA